MRGSGYKISAKYKISAALQFPPGRDRRIAHVNDDGWSKENHQEIHEEEQKSNEKEKENSCCRKKDEKNHPLGNIKSRNATYSTYSLN